jgi:hypothetical protein
MPFKMYPRLHNRDMACPQCTDFLNNSEKYVIDTISKTISVEADKVARTKVPMSEVHVSEDFIDYYMMFYRKTYETLFKARKEAALLEYKDSLCAIYAGRPDLCTACRGPVFIDETPEFFFDTPAKFCFHDSDSKCENCNS